MLMSVRHINYINFCRDNIIPSKTICRFPNNKPWINRDNTSQLTQKKQAFKARDREEARHIQRELKKKIWEAKNAYREKAESQLQQNNSKEVWRGLREMTGLKRQGPGWKGEKRGQTSLINYLSGLTQEPRTTPQPHSDALSTAPLSCALT